MTPTPSPDPGRCPECGCGWWEPHRTGCSEPRFLTPDPARYVSPVCRDGSHQACANFRGTCRCTCHAAAVEGTERPGGWRKKPVEVEARQVHYANRFDVAAWCGGEAQDAAPSGNVYAPGLLSINTLEGKMWASEGDWIIRGVKGEFYPCKPDIFAATYEPATPQPPVPPSPAPQADGWVNVGAMPEWRALQRVEAATADAMDRGATSFEFDALTAESQGAVSDFLVAVEAALLLPLHQSNDRNRTR